MKLRALSLLTTLLLAACSLSPRLPVVTLPAAVALRPEATTPSPPPASPPPLATSTPTTQPSPSPDAPPTPTIAPLPERISAQNAARLRPAAIYPLFRRGLLRAIAWSPDSQNLVVDTSLGAQILSAPQLEKRFSLPDVHPFYFLADGSLLTANGAELTRQDLAGGLARALPIQPPAQTGAVYALSPDGLRWVTADQSGGLRVQNLQDGAVQQVPLESKTRIALQADGLLFDATGERLFVHVTRVDAETEILALDTATWEILYELYNADSSPVFAPDGLRMAYQSGERILINKVEDGSNWTSFARTMLRAVEGQDSRLTAVAYSFMGSSERLGVLYTSAIRDEVAREIRFLPATLTIYNTASASVERAINGLPEHTNRFAFSPDGKLFYTSALDGVLRVWDSATGRELRASQPFDTDPNPAVRADGALMAYAQDGQAVLQDPSSDAPQATLGDYPAAINMAVQFAGEETLAISVQTPWNRFIDTYDIRTAQFLQRYPDLFGCGFSRNGSLMICPGDVVKFFEMPSGRALLSLVPQNNSPLEYAVSADGRRVASCSAGAEFVFVWEVQLGTIPKYRLGGQPGVCGRLAFTADGRSLASASGALWDVESGRVLAEFEPAGDGPAAISANNAILVVFPFIINLSSGAAVGELQAVPGVQTLAFQPDGRTLVLQTRRGIETWRIE